MAYTTINKSSDFFNTKLYTGNSGTQAITGVGFQPDLVWTKGRNQSESHYWTDAVRGTNSQIYSNGSNAQGTASNVITAFGTDGFTLGNNSEVNGGYNYASWNWKAGTGQGSSNTDGSINTTYTSVNTTAGFSISKFTGTGANATVGHGLGAVPKMIITKNLDQGSEGWLVYHASVGNTKKLGLNETSTAGTSSTYWQDTTPTSSVFSVGSNHGCNGPHNMIAYCFAEKTGYSKFGSYVGNGNANGTFVYTGFKPSWLMIKRTNSTENWHIFDIKRNPTYPTSSSYGGMATRLMANLTSADDLSQGGFEFLSNGLKMTTSWSGGNGSGDTFIYMCFGQSLVGSNNVPCTAR